MSVGQQTAMTFIKGAAILSVASLLSKLLGLVYRIPYQNITGDLGFYVFMQVYPLYSTLLILATAGFPIAISKIVSEYLAVGNAYGARRVFYISNMVLAVSGVLFFSLLFFGADIIAGFMGDPMLKMPIQSVSFALLIVPVMAAFRGYFQGHENMMPTAVSQIVEQLVRVITILVLAYWFMVYRHDVYLAGSGAVFGAVTGAFSALLVLLWYFRKKEGTVLHKKTGKLLDPQMENESALQTIKRIAAYALPICFGALVLPLFSLSDSFTVVNMLMVGGYSPVDAQNLKGIFDRGQPLVQFAAFFATALSLALVPSISAAKVRNETKAIVYRTKLALRITLLFSLPASVGLALVAEPVNVMLYTNEKGTLAIVILAFTTIFSTLGITSAGILQGLGQLMLPARHLAYGVVIKVALNILLVPLWGIEGAALSTVIAYSVATILNLYAIAKYTGMKYPVSDFLLKPVAAVGMMAIAVYVVEGASGVWLSGVIHSPRLSQTAVALISVFAGALVYGVAMFITGSLSKNDLLAVPKGERVVALLNRVGLLRN